jgi:8-oxo-dGTP pyrophosphatase MutT (NUDIX family)
MPISPYLKDLRELVGTQLLMLPGVCAIVFNEAGEVLLQDQGRGRWHTIGGMIEPGEQIVEALLLSSPISFCGAWILALTC